MDAQVLVVGAGPVGLTMAAELARYRVKVRIIDKAAQRTDKSKALVLWSRTLELLDRAGCTADFISAGRQITATNFVAGAKPIGRVSLAGLPTPYSFALMLPQSETERLLEAHLASLGITVERQVEAVGFAADVDGVSSTLRHADGRQETLRTAWLVGCDGAHSAVRHQLGLAFEGETLNADWLLADLHMRGLPFPNTELAMFLHEAGVLAIFPITADRYRIIADNGFSNGPLDTAPTLAQVQAVVDQRGPGGLVLSDPVWLSAFRINERKVKDYRAGRMFLAGDAAHVHSPAGGQGMNTGMQDAFNLAWKLALVCNGAAAAEPLLSSYSTERSAIGKTVLADAGRMTAAVLVKNRGAQMARNLLAGLLLRVGPASRMMARKLSELSVRYRHSPLNGPAERGGGLQPGQRLPPMSGQAPVGAGEAPRFALFAVASDTAARLAGDFAGLLEPAARLPLTDGVACLVRPDGYVAATEKDGDLAGIRRYLQSLLPPPAAGTATST